MPIHAWIYDARVGGYAGGYAFVLHAREDGWIHGMDRSGALETPDTLSLSGHTATLFLSGEYYVTLVP